MKHLHWQIKSLRKRIEMDNNIEPDYNQLCECKCHFGGAVSCPGCKDNHEIIQCEHCKK